MSTPTSFTWPTDTNAPAWYNPNAAVLVLTTAPGGLLAKRLAHERGEERVAAWAQVGATITAMYMWQGNLEGGDEVPISFKTSPVCADRLIQRIREMHPYQVPEVLVLPVVGGDPAYLAWLQEQTGAAPV